MKMLLAMDNSPASQTALLEILARPWPIRSSFDVITVVEPAHWWTTHTAREAENHAEVIARNAARQLCAAGFPANWAVLQGDPKDVILDRIRAFSAELVIMGAHGASAANRFLLGSVAATVLRYAPCSVEVARPRTAASSFGMRVLLATDGSEFSERAARSIAQRPWPPKTEIRVLNALELLLPIARALEPPFLGSDYIEAARAEAMKRSQDAIARALDILSGASFELSESVSVLVQPPKEIILSEAEEWGSNLIVLGSHGRHGIDRFVMGSVSEAVAMHAGCSVEVIR